MNTNPDRKPGLLRIKDKKFLEDAIDYIRENLGNMEYSVDELAENLNISRSQLYNKIHSALRLSPKTLIRNIRLEEAKLLLESGNLNVSEVSDKVGFNSPTYFNKCFHDYFGYAPGEIHKIKSESFRYPDRIDPLVNRNNPGIFNHKNYRSLLFKIAIGIIIIVTTSLVLSDLLSNKKENILSGTSIAVLPFTNAGTDVNQDYLVEGITHAIVNKLARVKGLTVISMSSVKRYNHNDTEYPEIARELNVSYILTGNILKSGDKMIINIHLMDAKGNKKMWNEIYNIGYNEIFNIESDITSAVAKQLHVNIKTGEQSDIDRPQTNNIESYDQFQRGLPYFINFILDHKQKDFELAMKYFTGALEIDSTYSNVYPHIAELLWFRNYRKDYFNESFMDTVRLLCEKALDLDPNLPYAYSILGQYYWETGKPVKGISFLEKAISLNNSFSDAHFHLGTYYSWMGEWEKGLSHLYASVELDPFSVFLPIIYGRIAAAYLDLCDFEKVDLYASRVLDLTGDNNFAASYGYWLKTHSRIVTGKWDEAMEYSKKLIACDSISGLRSMAEITSHYFKNYKDAIHLYEQLEYLDPNYANYKHRYAYALWMNGDQKKANELFDEQISQYEISIELGRIGRHDPLYNLAGIKAFRGDSKGALKLLKDYQFNSGLEYYITIDPLFENLWSNQEFKDLIKKVREEKSEIRARISKKYPAPL